jgi:uncharacterized protein (DUF2062 family)
MKHYFRKYLPHHQQVRDHPAVRWLGPLLSHPNLWHLNRRSVAGGVAVGAFTGLIPGPVQMLSAAILAVVFRVNLPVAVLTTLYTNPVTFVPLYLLAYEIGRRVVPNHHTSPQSFEFDWHGQNWLDAIPAFFHWMGSLGPALLVGVPLLGAALALIGYFTVRGAWRLAVVLQWRRRRRRKNLARE